MKYKRELLLILITALLCGVMIIIADHVEKNRENPAIVKQEQSVTVPVLSVSETSVGVTETTEAMDKTTCDHEDVLDPDRIQEYYVIVYTRNNRVLVLGADDFGRYNRKVKCFTCSTAKEGKVTPDGLYEIDAKYRWQLMFGGVYAQYAVRFYGDYLLHSVPYYTRSPDELETGEYEKLGTGASLGCVRLCVRDAKWIYDNLPKGTQVRVISGKNCGFRADPVPPIIYDSIHAGWDPTDPDPDNPYNITKGL